MDYENMKAKGIVKLMLTDGIITVEQAATYFPEFAKSEDEIIKEEIIDFLSLPHPQFVGKRDYEQWIVWLEKQGKQKPVKCMYSNGNYTDEERKKLCDSCDEDCKLKQKPTEWNEEDKMQLDAAIHLVNSTGHIETTNWLKTLKDRVQSQPKSEWNVEDEKILNTILEEGNLKPSEKVWLKSLRPQKQCGYNPYKETVESIAEMCKKYTSPTSNLSDFLDNVKVKCKDAKEYDSLFLQSTQKPSDEQIDALEIASRQIELYDYQEALESLLEVVILI